MYLSLTSGSTEHAKMKCNLFPGPFSHRGQFEWDCFKVAAFLLEGCKSLTVFVSLVISLGYDEAVYQTG